MIAILVATHLCAAELPIDLSEDGDASSPHIIKDVLKFGKFGPEMVVVPIGGKRVANCIPKRVCDETITDIVRSMITSPYAISRYEITFDEYDLYCEATGRPKPEDNGWGRGSRPVIFVAWKDALRYVDWMSEQTGFTYRLPSVVEWEHAARAGKHTAYWWGSEIEANRANCSDCGTKWSGLQTAPVGSFPPNPWGIYDMHGNVSEFTQDCAVKNKRRLSPFRSRLMNEFRAKPEFIRDCARVRSKGFNWLTTYQLAFRRESDQNNPSFPERFVTTPIQNKTAAKGIRVVREM